ncbi:MAG: TonB-dependent receptor [Cyclobacteriaceae bacterium]|jgi:outer membrane receptor for ferrienterochelin and colicins
MKHFVIAAAIAALSFTANGQKLMGLVVEKNAKGVDQPLPGANVYWLGTSIGTTTRDNGVFMIDRLAGADRLVVSYVGYRADTLLITDQTSIKVELAADNELQEVVVEGWRPTSRVDLASSINTVIMDEKELFKAACCNLSESFETNPSVDVAFTDAVTGTRQIQMLGLSGPNTLISLENMPGVRGLASSQGIQFVPGTWINSIQVTKGVGSVVNGYESIAGQLNVELKKPQESDKVYLNGYVNNAGRVEANAIVTSQVTPKWATTTLLHVSARPFEMDQNGDTFLDFPLGSQVNLVNRWVYNSGTGWLGQLSLKYLNDQKIGGQTGFDAEDDKFTTTRYGFEIDTRRLELVGKLGYQFPSKPYKSVGFQFTALTHGHDSYYGFNVHDATENSGYFNLIYQSIIVNTQHKFKTGVSFLMDDFTERLARADGAMLPVDFDRSERVPGAFFEYSYDDLKRFSVVAGLRVDQHNLFGTIVTPRIHTKLNITETTTWRLSGGTGTRVANIIAENTGFLVSSRVFNRQFRQSNSAYGFKPDRALNVGTNLQQDFTLNYRPGSLSVDYFYTKFLNQVVMDLDANPQAVSFFGLQGESFSHSLQVQLDYQLVRRFDVRLAYRFLDVQTDYLNGRLERPMISRHRAFSNFAYTTKSKWNFDLTVQWLGKQRLPNTASNPAPYRLTDYSDDYVLVNAQVAKDINERWSAYVGIENLTNFRLTDPIIAASEPFSPYFDTSLVWGPVFGRMAYAGFRFRIK